MSGFRRRHDGELEARFTAVERELMTSLVGQLIAVLDGAVLDGAVLDGAVLDATRESAAHRHGDPALRRLLPDAYPGDPEASAEFRRFTAESITEAKIANARAVIESLAGGAAPVPLSDTAAQSWLRTLTDLRLTLATRLGIEHDGDEGNRDIEAIPLQELYLWFGSLQESLLEALEGGP